MENQKMRMTGQVAVRLLWTEFVMGYGYWGWGSQSSLFHLTLYCSLSMSYSQTHLLVSPRDQLVCSSASICVVLI